MINYIDYDRLKREIRQSDGEYMTIIQTIAKQPVCDVIPVEFIKRYIDRQERDSVYQWALYALLGAWILEKADNSIQ